MDEPEQLCSKRSLKISNLLNQIVLFFHYLRFQPHSGLSKNPKQLFVIRFYASYAYAASFYSWYFQKKRHMTQIASSSHWLKIRSKADFRKWAKIFIPAKKIAKVSHSKISRRDDESAKKIVTNYNFFHHLHLLGANTFCRLKDFWRTYFPNGCG